MMRCANCGHRNNSHPPAHPDEPIPNPYHEKCTYTIDTEDGPVTCPCKGWDPSKNDKKRRDAMFIARAKRERLLTGMNLRF